MKATKPITLHLKNGEAITDNHAGLLEQAEYKSALMSVFLKYKTLYYEVTFINASSTINDTKGGVPICYPALIIVDKIDNASLNKAIAALQEYPYFFSVLKGTRAIPK
jgi:hypothetical protein